MASGKMKLVVVAFLLSIDIAVARPKSSSTEGGIVLNDIPSSSGSRPRIEQPYLRHALTSDLRRPEGQDFCRKTAKCQPIKTNICLTTKLPYSQTSLELVTDSHTQDDVQDKLMFWQNLKSVPKCWAVIQPFLCALYMPRCENGTVELPSQEMCKVIRNPCRIVELEQRGGWPDFMRCEDTEKFPSGCKNEVRELKFNITPKCQSPLVETDNSLAYVEGVDGCGLPCNSPLFTKEEHEQVQRFTQTLVAMCLTTNLFAVFTFLIDWRSASRYPAVIIFYMNVCFAAACIGWIAQYIPSARQDIICRKDGTARVSEPSGGETLSCVVIFILIYYFLMAACVWFVMLAYSWFVSFQALGKIREKVSSKAAYFHLVSWSIPLVLTITCMALAQVEAQSPHGICFVANSNVVRSGFVLAPVLILLFVGHVFLYRGLLILIRLKLGSAASISASANSKLRNTIVRLASFSISIIGSVVLTFVCHIYEFERRSQWKTSFRSYMVCLANQNTSRIQNQGLADDCELESRPSMTITQVHLIAVFGAGVAVSSWVWTKASVLAWRRWYRRTFDKRPLDERVRIRKHKIIAQAFAKRRDLNHMGRMSISIHSTHDDPVGFGNLDLNSAASNDVSSAWAAAIPKFVTRRGAIVGAAGAFGLRRNSLDSEISMSAVRRISVESRASQSRRHSFDSQYSVHSQQTTDLERLTRLHFRHGGRKRNNMLRGGRKMALRRRAITKRKNQLLPLGATGATVVQIQTNDKRQSSQVDLERIERFSLNLPGDGSSDDSDIDNGESCKITAAPVTQSTQTTVAWNVATQTSPSLSTLRPISLKIAKPTTQSVSKGTQVTSSSSSSPSSSASTSPVVRKSLPKPSTTITTNVSSSKCHRERGQADGSPNGSSSDLSGHVSASLHGLSSPSQSLLDYLLPIKNQSEKKSDDRQLNGSKGRSNRNRKARSRGVEAIELDRSSIARLLEKLREEDHKAAVEAANAAAIDSDERPKRSYDRRHRVERNRRSQSERHDGNEIELDCLLSSKNSNRSDRSRKSDSRRSRSKQETVVNDDDIS
ncbi:Smoothened protein [Daphnia magna]|uniref:Protein smoothened n=1 Tax=Daphnia magna TaxID=35525 RepID=A0A164K3P3_9CRUS|nr:Smoothened protein [Daphnia magna]